MNMTAIRLSRACGALLLVSLLGCSGEQTSAELQSLKQRLAEVEATEKMAQVNLDNFDDLDFNVYSGQKWDELGRSHSQDITVHWPDGRTTKGIQTHIDDLKGMFVLRRIHASRSIRSALPPANGRQSPATLRAHSANPCQSVTARRLLQQARPSNCRW